MTDPMHGLRTLVDLPASPPPPVEGLRRRAETRRRRRRLVRSSMVGVAAVLAGVAVVPLVDRPPDAPTQVVAAATGATLALESDEDCAYLRLGAGDPPLAGGCPTDPPNHSVRTYWPAAPLGNGSNATIVRGGPSMARFVARLADGRTVEGDLGAHGWALVVTDGRIAGVSGIDTRGLPVPEWIVP